MIVVTFYSFKGGVGRSMALANVAELLAAKGRNVVLCDFDLEAPGLERFAIDSNEAAEGMRTWPGIMDLLLDYKDTVTRAAPQPSATSQMDGKQYQMIGEGLRLRRPSSYARLVREYSSGGAIRLLTAGRRDGVWQQRYASNVQSFDWTDFYEKWEGAAYLNFFRQDLSASGADVVLVDSRTGVTEQSGVCTHDLADAVVLLCAASDQNLSGTRWMVDTLSRPELVNARGGRPLDLLVVAARVDQRAEVTLLGEFRDRFATLFDRHAQRWGLAEIRSEKKEIPYIAHYAFNERVVSRGIETAQRGAEGMLDAYRLLSECVERRLAGALPTPAAQKPPPIAIDSTPATAAEFADLLSLRSQLDENEKRSASLSQKVEETRATHWRYKVGLIAGALLIVGLASIAVKQAQTVAAMNADASALRTSLDAQLRSVTQSLSDQAKAAQDQVTSAKSAAERAQIDAKTKADNAQRLFDEAQAAKKKSADDFHAAAKRADDARAEAERARFTANAAILAQSDAVQAATAAALRASQADRDAQQALADRDIARQALDSERAARSQVEARLATQTSTSAQLQQDLSSCKSQLIVRDAPVATQIMGQIK